METPGDAISREIAALHDRPLRPPSPWHRLTVRSVAVVLTVVIVAAVVGALALGSHHYDTSVRNPKFCSTADAINDLIGTELTTLSVVHEGDLVSCSYNEGAGQALSVDVDQPNTGVGANNAADFGTDNPCKGRPPITVAGLPGCVMTGAVGTTPGEPSLLVKDDGFDCQFTSYVDNISMIQLEKLAVTYLTPSSNEV